MHHSVFAGPAGIFGSADDQHAELRRDDIKPLARILADLMQRAAATRTGVVVDVDHYLDARQVRGKRSTIHPTLGGSIGPLRRIGRVNLGIAARLDLLDVFEPEQHLIFGQRLCSSAEAMALQFLDDLTEPLVLYPLRNQHRFQRARIVGKRIRHNGHDGIRSCSAPRRERFPRADLLCRNHPGCIGAGISRAA